MKAALVFVMICFGVSLVVASFSLLEWATRL